MEIKDLLIAKSKEARESFLPHISIDCVVFGFHGGSLKVLLTRMKGQQYWMLPGGYLGKDEELEHAATRILQERTGVPDVYLQQFRIFSGLQRSEAFFEDYPDDLWHKQRFLTVGFYALVDFSAVQPIMDEYSDACEWKELDALPELIMDHKGIVCEALIKIRRGLNFRPVGYNLLPEEFTMPELQRLYEAILGKQLNRGNFYRKMMAYDILDKMPEPRRGGAHKSPNLYKFNLERYTAALEDGLKEGW